MRCSSEGGQAWELYHVFGRREGGRVGVGTAKGIFTQVGNIFLPPTFLFAISPLFRIPSVDCYIVRESLEIMNTG